MAGWKHLNTEYYKYHAYISVLNISDMYKYIFHSLPFKQRSLYLSERILESAWDPYTHTHILPICVSAILSFSLILILLSHCIFLFSFLYLYAFLDYATEIRLLISRVQVRYYFRAIHIYISFLPKRINERTEFLWNSVWARSNNIFVKDCILILWDQQLQVTLPLFLCCFHYYAKYSRFNISSEILESLSFPCQYKKNLLLNF